MLDYAGIEAGMKGRVAEAWGRSIEAWGYVS